VSDGESKGHGSLEEGGRESGRLHIGINDLAGSLTQRRTDASDTEDGSLTQRRTDASDTEDESEADNSFAPPEVERDVEDGRHPGVDSPEEAAEEEENDDDDSDGESLYVRVC